MNLTALLDEDVPVFLEDFIPHGTHHGFELGEGRKGILLGCFKILLCLLCSIGSKYLVNNRLRASAFMVVLYLASIGRDSRSHNVQVRIVCIVVGIDEPGLSGFCITHFLEILVRKIEQLGFRHFVTLAGDGLSLIHI